MKVFTVVITAVAILPLDLGADETPDAVVPRDQTRQTHEVSESKTVTDVIVNRGVRFTNSREVTVDPLNVKFPAVSVEDLTGPKGEPIILKNPGSPIRFTLPDRGDGEYILVFQFLDAGGKPQGHQLIRSIILDTLPPVVKIVSPKNNSTTDQGFVHVQAIAFDPSVKGKEPDEFEDRRISIWVNGGQFWDMQGTRIDIPRFDVQEGTNTLTIVAEDEASNRTEVVTQWIVDLGIDKTPPKLSDINLIPDRSGKVILPNEPEVDVMGHLDDPKAIVTASLNGDEPTRVNVTIETYADARPMFFRRLHLNEGENTLVLSAIDGAGNASDYRFTLVRSDRYRCTVTSPAPGEITAGPRMTIVEGYISALRDAGTKTQARLVAVFVNDVPTTLEPEDADGNIHFRTTRAVPPSWHGFPGAMYVRVRWSDGEEY